VGSLGGFVLQSHFITLTVGLLLSGGYLNGPAVAAEDALTKEEAAAIGVDAYLYLYPLVTMNLTREQATNVEAGKTMGRGPANMFTNVPQFPTAEFRDVVRPNFDTLYSVAWLDMTKEPMIVSAPDTNGRYYLLPMLDMWTDVFASPGWRPTGTAKADFAVVPLAGQVRSSPPERNGSMHRHPMFGSSDVRKRMDRPTTTPFTRSRLATRSRHCRNGVRRPSRPRSRSILTSI